MINDHFPYVHEQGRWIPIENDEPNLLVTALKAVAGGLAIGALLWFCCVVFFSL